MAIAIASWSFGVGCGVDNHGTGPSDRKDSGTSDAGLFADDAAAIGNSGGTSGGAGAAPGDAAAGTGKGLLDSASGEGSSGGATGDGGGGVGAQDAATSDVVAVLSADGGTLCGPCSQGQQCDPTLGCVDCTMDSQCPASTRFCVQGSCVQCKTNTDCGSGTTPSCYPANHTCRAACASSQECQQQDKSAPICDVITGACVGCGTAADCPTSKSVCDPTTQQCVQCTSSADCAGTSTPACARNACVQCASNSDCSGATPYCTSGGDNAWQCVQCIASSQCPSSIPRCGGGTCQKSGG